MAVKNALVLANSCFEIVSGPVGKNHRELLMLIDGGILAIYPCSE